MFLYLLFLKMGSTIGFSPGSDNMLPLPIGHYCACPRKGGAMVNVPDD